MPDLGHDTERVCPVGGHRHHNAGVVCDRHLAVMDTQLAALPRLVQRLTFYLIPGPNLPGERVSTTRFGAPTPTNLAVLSLIGPGVREVRLSARSLVPQVRRWRTNETVDVTAVRDGAPVTATRQVSVWHQELVVDQAGHPVKVVADDQVGAVPPAEWLDGWVVRWRRGLQQFTPTRHRVPGAATISRVGRLGHAAVTENLRLAAGYPTLLPAVVYYLAVSEGYRRHLATARTGVGQTMLGVRAGHPGVPGPDVVAAEWRLRYGAAVTAASVDVDANYLRQWLPYVSDLPGTDIGPFAAELRALHAELEHVLGDTKDEQWIGRCPAHLRDHHTGDETDRVCGGPLWQDPYRSQIECPRCHSTWGERDWLRLAVRIRYEWPIDRRRRYTLEDRRDAETNVDRLPRCAGCDELMVVEWSDSTTVRDREPTWRPVRLSCPQQCLAGGKPVAA
jgi:hypothetical protein